MERPVRTSATPSSASAGSLRGRLQALGARALSDMELAAVVIGGGSGAKALQSARSAMSALEGDGLERVAALPSSELERRVGAAAAARLSAALELGRRAATQPLERGQRLRGPSDIHGLFSARLRHLPQEEFHVLLLDARHRLLRASLVTRGTADTSLVHRAKCSARR